MPNDQPKAQFLQDVKKALAPYSIPSQDLYAITRRLSGLDPQERPHQIVRVFAQVAKNYPQAEPAIQSLKSAWGTPLTKETEEKLRDRIAHTPLPQGLKHLHEHVRAEQLAFISLHTEESARKFITAFDVVEKTRVRSIELGRQAREPRPARMG